MRSCCAAVEAGVLQVGGERLEQLGVGDDVAADFLGGAGGDVLVAVDHRLAGAALQREDRDDAVGDAAARPPRSARSSAKRVAMWRTRSVISVLLGLPAPAGRLPHCGAANDVHAWLCRGDRRNDCSPRARAPSQARKIAGGSSRMLLERISDAGAVVSSVRAAKTIKARRRATSRACGSPAAARMPQPVAPE